MLILFHKKKWYFRFVKSQKRGSTEVLATVNIEKFENITNSSKRSNSKKVRGKN